MITRFENHTAPLSATTRQEMVPHVVALLSERRGKAARITNTQIRHKLQELVGGEALVAEATLRAIIHEIRIDGLVPDLVASERGYYVAVDEADLQEYLESLQERVRSIQAVRRSLFQHSRLVAQAAQGDQLPLFK